MTVHIYGMGNIDFSKSEMRQYNRVRDRIIDSLDEDEKEYFLIVDYIIGSKQYDLILLKNEAIIIIDLKAYSGEVKGEENGDWYVYKPNGQEIKIDQAKNPFRQLRDQRYELINFLNENLSQTINRFENDNLNNISAVICFEEGSEYDLNQINPDNKLWFDVISEDQIVELVKNANSREFHLKNYEIESFLSNLNIEEKGETEKLEISKGVLSKEDIKNITEKIDDIYGDEEFSLQNLVEIIEPETAIRYLKEGKSMDILEEVEGENKFVLAEDYEKNLTIEEKEERDVNVGRFTEEDFYLRPKDPEVGEIYEGVYRGTEYSMNYKREVWWRRDWNHPKHTVKFSDEEILEKILELKSQGGSFRITEAKEVLTKVYDEEKEDYIPIYVGKLEGDIELEEFDWDPDNIEKGDLWPAPYDGSTFSVNPNGDLKLRIGGIKTKAIEGHQELVKKVLKFRKSGGGRFKINENGKILTLLYEAPYPEKIQEQMKRLTDEEK
ncbi:MAG: nuclease-related domain-containing protein, partial [Thermoplasmatota archaeon]